MFSIDDLNREFCQSAKKAEHSGLDYGLELEPDAGNRHDPLAIRVVGRADVQRLLRGVGVKRWHIGFVPREETETITPDIIQTGEKYCAELYGIFEDGDFVEIGFFVLIPKASPASLRHERRIAKASGSELTEEQRRLLASRQMGLFRNTRLLQAAAFRKLGDYQNALDMYLRVLWIDLGGPSNAVTDQYGRPVEGFMDKAMGEGEKFLAPGIIDQIAKGTNTMKLTSQDLRERFLDVGRSEREVIAPLEGVPDDQAGWSVAETRLAQAIATGTKWRIRRQPTNKG